MTRFQPPSKSAASQIDRRRAAFAVSGAAERRHCEENAGCLTEPPPRVLEPAETLAERQQRLRADAPIVSEKPASSSGASEGFQRIRSAPLAAAGLQRRGGERDPATVSAPSLEVIALNRLGFGPEPGDLAAFRALGTTGPERLVAWVDRQLDPGSIDDRVCDQAERNAELVTLGKSFQQIWDDHVLPDPEWEIYIRPFYETELRTLVRARYSKRQLFETTVRFWHDHFNVHGEEAGPLFLTYDRDVIRRHALGNFRQMLGDVVKHPVMLEYLDNKYNSYEPGIENDGLNENFSRELLELHTLGAEHYFRNVAPEDVPMDSSGRPAGYTDADVTAAARCLTGWTVSDQPWYEEIGNRGGFFYFHEWHDTENDKVVLGRQLTSKSVPMRDGEDLLDILAAHPGTARFVARKLCRRFVADEPSEALVAAAADVFLQNVDEPDQIARVIRRIVLSSEFRTTFGQKVKRPFEIFISALRAGRASFPFRYDDDVSNGLTWSLYLTGNLPFAWHPPNGYPDVKEAWTTSAPRVVSWNLVNWLPFSYRDEWWGPAYFDVAEQTPSTVQTAAEVVDFWSERIYGRRPPGAERQILVDFMANGRPHNEALDWSQPWLAPDRLRSTVGLMMLSPSFLLL